MGDAAGGLSLASVDQTAPAITLARTVDGVSSKKSNELFDWRFSILEVIPMAWSQPRWSSAGGGFDSNCRLLALIVQR